MTSIITNLGRIIPNHKGAYSPSVQYHFLDEVFFERGTYRVKSGGNPPIATPPSNETYWTLVNSPGASVISVTSEIQEENTVDVTFHLDNGSSYTTTFPVLGGPPGIGLVDTILMNNHDGTYTIRFVYEGGDFVDTITGDLTGEAGPPPELSIGKVTTLGSDKSATVTIEDDGPGKYDINFGIPQGIPGVSINNVTSTNNGNGTFNLKFAFDDSSTKSITAPNLAGDTGPAPTLTVNKVSTLEPDKSATFSVTEDTPGTYKIDVGIPQGITGVSLEDVTLDDNNDGTFDLNFAFDDSTIKVVTSPDLTGPVGPPPELSVNVVTTLTPDKPATFSFESDGPGAYKVDIGIPQGKTGDGDVTAPVSSVAVDDIVLFGNVDGNLLKGSGTKISDLATANHNHDGVYAPSGYFDTGILKAEHLPAAVFQAPIVSSGGIANLTSPQQTDIREGSHVVTTDGRVWIYSGSGSKTAEGSYIELADKTPEWSVIANKPNSISGYGITDAYTKGEVDSALSGKASSSHTHAAADISDASVNGRSLITAADYAGMKTLLSVANSGVIGSSGLTMATDRMLGRTTASTGAVQEITVGDGLSFTSTNLAIDKATAANVRAGASNKVLTADNILSALGFVAAGDANLTPNFNNFFVTNWTINNNRVLQNPTNATAGSTRYIFVQASGGTRTVTFGNQYLGTLPTLNDIKTTKWYLLVIVAYSSTHFCVSAIQAK